MTDPIIEAMAKSSWELFNGPWEFVAEDTRELIRAEQKAAYLAALPMIAEDFAKAADKRRDERFAEYGATEPDTNASYYSGRYGETLDTLDEEDEEIAQAIRALAAAKVEELSR